MCGKSGMRTFLALLPREQASTRHTFQILPPGAMSAYEGALQSPRSHSLVQLCPPATFPPGQGFTCAAPSWNQGCGAFQWGRRAGPACRLWLVGGEAGSIHTRYPKEAKAALAHRTASHPLSSACSLSPGQGHRDRETVVCIGRTDAEATPILLAT